jgi:amidohydrolase
MNIKLNINRNDIAQLASSYRKYIIEVKGEFQPDPESGLHEAKTAERIRAELDRLNIPYTICANSGIVATIQGNSEGNTVALRADMDESEINEKALANYDSENKETVQRNGSNGHAAMLLGAARILNEVKNEINGKVKLIFQPVEELAGGAAKMVEEGVMEAVDSVFGIHLWPHLESGKISVEAGPRMASVDIFKVKVSGKSGHASLPHHGVDAILAASSIVMDLQSIVSREISPFETAVVTVGMFSAGKKYNSLASEALLEGTTRCYNYEIRNSLPDIMKRIVEHTAKSYRAQAELEYKFAAPPIINDPKCSQIAEGIVERLWGKDTLVRMDKLTVGEDFALYMEKAPGVLAFIGTKTVNKEAKDCQVNKGNNINEDSLIMGTLLYAQYAIDFLKG